MTASSRSSDHNDLSAEVMIFPSFESTLFVGEALRRATPADDILKMLYPPSPEHRQAKRSRGHAEVSV
jgi:hypothetical protein